MPSLSALLNEPDWDAPFFKKLPGNDTGEAPGHQSGVVIPKDLREFFPVLAESEATSEHPTVERHLRAELYDGALHVGKALVRYQFQTWGGTRTAESRVTDGLKPLHEISSEDDIMIFQRRHDSLDSFRFILIRKDNPEYKPINQLIGDIRWGILEAENLPVTQTILNGQTAAILSQCLQAFSINPGQQNTVETRQTRIARSTAFKALVRAEYECTCVVTRNRIMTPGGLPEVESAHIVPLSKGGPDDIRNGLSLTRTLHWAFDRGLFGIKPDGHVIIPRQVRELVGNQYLIDLEDVELLKSNDSNHHPHPDALAWHCENIVRQWD